MLEKFSLKYPNRVPHNYDKSEMQFTFDFIHLILKHDKSIDEAIGEVSKQYNLSNDYLNDYLIENKYLINKTRKNEFIEELKKYNTKTLKKILKKNNLKTSGKREQIVNRLFKNNLLGNYQLSSKSKLFYKNKKRRINIFNDYLAENYYFREFNDFYMNNYRKKKDKIPIEFIKQHIIKSLEDKDHINYIISNQIMANHYRIKENYNKMLEYVLRNYCMDLNPIWKIDYLKGHVGISFKTYDDLIFLKTKLSKNAIINRYYLVWDSYDFDRIIVSKFEGYRYLKDILNMKDFTRLNDNLDKDFYANDDLKIKTIIQKTLFDF